MSRERLAKLLGMLGSDFDGERATAAAMIAKMAKEAKMGVAEFVMQGGGPQIIYRDRIVEKTVYRDRPTADDHMRNYRREYDDFSRRARSTFTDDDVRQTGKRKAKPPPKDGLIDGLRWAQHHPEHLSGFEVEFIDDMLRHGYDDDDLSWKQAKVARRIIAKVKVHEDPLI
jgi:hypothetical protein